VPTKQFVYDNDSEMSRRDIDQLVASIADRNRMDGRCRSDQSGRRLPSRWSSG
jgi:hypothetical protein